MSKFKTMTHLFFAITCVLIVHSKSFAEPANLTVLKQSVREYHDSGAYQQELARILASATDYITKRTTTNARAKKPAKLAVVLDIDETSISNYQHIAQRDFAYNKKQWNQDVIAADAPAIEPMLKLYNLALQKHVALFFVTGRTESLKQPTINNLQSAGYQNWTGLYLRPEVYKQPSIAAFKAKTRAEITKKGYTIIASIGDQASDFSGGYAEKAYKLPNPYYYIQ